MEDGYRTWPDLSSRRGQIEDAAQSAYPYSGGTKGAICDNAKPIFIQGAEWADANPKKPDIWHDMSEEAPLGITPKVMFETKYGDYFIGIYRPALRVFEVCSCEWINHEVKRWCYLSELLKLTE